MSRRSRRISKKARKQARRATGHTEIEEPPLAAAQSAVTINEVQEQSSTRPCGWIKFHQWFISRHLTEDIQAILHLPLLERLLHHKARRPLAGVTLGVVLMLSGSAVAASAKALEEISGVAHIAIDTIGYFVHGLGAIPALRYVEPVWTLVLGSAEEVA